MPPLPDLFVAGLEFGLGLIAAVSLCYTLGRLLDRAAHVVRWYVWRPLLRRRYLRRVAKQRAGLDRAEAMRRHPAGKAYDPDALNHTLS